MSRHIPMCLLILAFCSAEIRLADPAPARRVQEARPVSSLVREVLDVPYTASGDPRQSLDIYFPLGTPHPTVLVFVQGSGWQVGDKENYTELGHTFAGYYSYTTVVLNYRLSNPDDGDVVHPAHVQDVARAFAWLKARIQEYGGDPRRIFLFGQSAGGHLVSLLAADERYLREVGCSPGEIRGVIAMSGLYDLPNFVEYPFNPLGLSLGDTILYKGMFFKPFGGWEEEVLSGASPATYVDARQPPFRIISVDYDMPGLLQSAGEFHRALVQVDGPRPVRVHLNRSDFSDQVWSRSVEMAEESGFGEEVAGHWAEVVAINMNEPRSTSTLAVVEFVEALNGRRD